MVAWRFLAYAEAKTTRFKISHTAWFFILVTVAVTSFARAETPVPLKFSRSEIEAKWKERIQSFLDRDMVPLIDLLSFLDRKDAEAILKRTIKTMDAHGVALISFAGYWAPGGGKANNYIWGYYIHDIVNRYPGHFILTTNKGSNWSWWKQKSGKPKFFIDQLEQQVRGGNYFFIGQIEFRHYMSNAQCKAKKVHRDIDIPLNGKSGHRIFSLSVISGLPVAIHLEPEDASLTALEEMLSSYPKANVIISHFGQIRHPEKEKRFGPELVERLLNTYPNLYYDLSAGEPGGYYRCGDHKVLDTVIWENTASGAQTDSLKAEYKAIFTRFSTRFVAGFDYGPDNRQTDSFLQSRIANIRLIIRDLPDQAKHNIGYRNAWFLLTHKPWQ